MIKVVKTMWVNKGRKSEKMFSETREYEDIYECYRDVHLSMVRMPESMEMDIEVVKGKDKKLVATILGMDGGIA